MISKLKSLLLNVLAAVNITCIVLMLVAGYSDRFSPVDYPWLAAMGLFFPFFVLLCLLFVPVWVLLNLRRLLIPIVGFLLAYFPIRIYMPLHGNTHPADNDIVVVTYNVCGFGGNYKYEHGLDSVCDYLESLHPDIICLQEEQYYKSTPTQERIGRFMPYNDTTCVSKTSGKLVNAIGIHTRFPILRKEIIDYPSNSNGSVAYYLKREHDTLIVINNHLESSHLNNKDRHRYEEMIEGSMESDTIRSEATDLLRKLTGGMAIRAGHVEKIRDFIENHNQYPIIVCGDFNDTPISYTRHVMSIGMADCFVEAGQGLGLSFNRRWFNLRIDHMMCSDEFEPVKCIVDSKMDASDHYPLICWLRERIK